MCKRPNSMLSNIYLGSCIFCYEISLLISPYSYHSFHISAQLSFSSRPCLIFNYICHSSFSLRCSQAQHSFESLVNTILWVSERFKISYLFLIGLCRYSFSICRREDKHFEWLFENVFYAIYWCPSTKTRLVPNYISSCHVEHLDAYSQSIDLLIWTGPALNTCSSRSYYVFWDRSTTIAEWSFLYTAVGSVLFFFKDEKLTTIVSEIIPSTHGLLSTFPLLWRCEGPCFQLRGLHSSCFILLHCKVHNPTIQIANWVVCLSDPLKRLLHFCDILQQQPN